MNTLNVGMDLGGSLSKICLFLPNEPMDESAKKIVKYINNHEQYGNSGVREDKLSFTSKTLNGQFVFIRYETSRTSGAIELIKNVVSPGSYHALKNIHATGGGALKYSKLFEEQLGIKLIADDELETVVRGIVFTVMENPSTCYTIDAMNSGGIHYNESSSSKLDRIPRPLIVGQSLFPLLVVNIGSGVSIVKVESKDEMRRVSGTALGGGTYFGLCKLLTRCETFDEAMNMADIGDSRRVNMLVSDIYGPGGYDRVGLPGSVTASFFGKAATTQGATRPASSGSHEDIIEARRERFGPKWIRVLRDTSPLHIPFALLTCVVLNVFVGDIAMAFFAFTIVFFAMFVQISLHFRKQEKLKLENANTTNASNKAKKQKEAVFRDEDISRALVTMIAQNVTQLAYLNAKLHQTNRIIFTGNFLRHNTIALRTLTTNLRLWSGGEVEAIFTEHEGFFGAIGALLVSRAHLEESGMMKETKSVPLESQERKSSFSLPKHGDDVFHVAEMSPKMTSKNEIKSEKEFDKMSNLRLT